MMIKETIKEFYNTKIQPFIMDFLNKKIFTVGLGSLIIKAANNLLTFLMGILLVRSLGLDQYGVYSFVLSFALLLYIPAEFGLPNLLVRETAKAFTHQKPEIVRGLWSWSYKLTTILVSSLLLISGLGLFLFRNQLSPSELETLKWSLLLVPIMALIHLTSGVLRGLNKIIIGQLSDQIILPGSMTIILFILFLLGNQNADAKTGMIIRVISAAFGLIFCLIYFIRIIPDSVKKVKPVIYSRIWLSSTWLMALSTGMNLIKNRSNVLILGFLSDSLEVGVYQVALHASLLASIIIQTADIVLGPKFATLYAAKKMKKLQSIVTANIQIMLVLTITITVIFILWGRFILSFMFGPESEMAYLPLLILLVGQIINAMTGSVVLLLNMTGFEKQAMIGSGISALSTILLNLILTPKFGSIGTAIATSASLSVSQIFMAVMVYKHINIKSFFLVFKKINEDESK